MKNYRNLFLSIALLLIPSVKFCFFISLKLAKFKLHIQPNIAMRYSKLIKDLLISAGSRTKAKSFASSFSTSQRKNATFFNTPYEALDGIQDGAKLLVGGT